MTCRVALVGAGPGDPGLLTVKAARLLRSADVLIYDALASDPIVALAPATCEKIYVGKRARAHTMPQEEISRVLVERAAAGKRVVRLKGGDPFVFGRGGEEAQELRAAGIAFEVVPGISSALAAPAYAGIPVTHRSYNTNFTIATGHEDPTKGLSTLDWERLGSGHGTSVFLMAMGHLPGIVAELMAHGRAENTPVAIISDGTTPRQRTVTATLETIVEVVEQTKIGAPAIVIVGDVVRVRDEVRWFDELPLFGQRVLITRPLEEDGELVQALWEQGAQPLIVPAVEIGPPDDAAELAATVAEWLAGARFDWLVFTSRNGVKRWFSELAKQGGDARSIGSARVAVIGESTAAELAAYGIRADVQAAQTHSEGLAAELLRVLDGGPVQRMLLCIAQGGRGVLAAALTRAGHDVRSLIAYRMVPAAAGGLQTAAHEATMWTFTSGSAVRAFLAAVPDAVTAAAAKRIVSIGPVTTEALQEHGFHVAATAETTSTAGLLAALETAALLIPSTP